MKKKALIFGVSGQDGTFLSKFLLKKNYEVYGITRRIKQKFNFDKKKIKLLELNDFDKNNINDLIKNVKPDEIYNLSGLSSVAQSYQKIEDTFTSIVDLNYYILEALLNFKNIKYYNACSSECFGDTGNERADENTPFKPLSPYAIAKSTAYWTSNMYKDIHHLYACSGILFNHESNIRPNYFVSQKVISSANRISKGSNEILELGDISIIRDWGWAPEYVEAMWLMLQKDKPENYVIATGKSHSLQKFVKIVFEEFNIERKKHVLINKKYIRSNELKKSKANPKLAREKLGWKAKTEFKVLIKKLISQV